MYGKRLARFRAGMMMRGAKRRLCFAWLLKKLDLTDEQRERLRTIFFNAKKEGIRKWADARVAHVETMQMLLQKDVDRTSVEDAVRNASSKRVELRLLKIRTLLDVLAVLTDAQRAKLRAMTGFHGLPWPDFEDEDEEEGEEEEGEEEEEE